MNTPLAVRIECAKGEILNAMETIQKRHALPPCIMDGVLSSVLAEVRSEAKIIKCQDRMYKKYYIKMYS